MPAVAVAKPKISDIVFGHKGVERRISFLAAAILVLAVLATGIIIFAVLANQLRGELENGMVRTLNDKAVLFQHEIGRGNSFVVSIATRRPRLSALMSAANAGTDIKEIRRELSLVLDIIRADMKLSALALYDVRGKQVGGSGTFISAPFAVSLRQPKNAALLWHDGFYLAVTAAMQQNGVNIGSVRMELPLTAMTAAFLDYQGSGETGEIVLCAALSDERMRCFPTRLHPEPFDVPRGGKDGKTLPMSLAIAGKSGVVTSLITGCRTYSAPTGL